MYDLWIGNKNASSWSLRPWLLMQVTQIPFTEHLAPFGDKKTRHARYLKFSPTGKVPCLHDQIYNLQIWDSLAIFEYLAEQHPHIYPQEQQARAWSRCAIAEMHAGFATLREQCPMNCALDSPLTEISSELQQDIQRIDALWQQGLNEFGGNFLAGEQFSAVDAYFAPVVLRAKSYHLPFSTPSQAWMQRMLALPELQTWIEAGKVEDF